MVMFKMNIILVVLIILIWIRWIYYRQRLRFLESLKDLVQCLSDKDSKLVANRSNDADIRALVVTAHPDDECMFFAPTIVKLIELKSSVQVLCLSEGNYYSKGSWRKQELLDSCAVLGIPASDVTIVDHNTPSVYQTKQRIYHKSQPAILTTTELIRPILMYERSVSREINDEASQA